jgi:hypothetical protein
MSADSNNRSWACHPHVTRIPCEHYAKRDRNREGAQKKKQAYLALTQVAGL